MATWIIGDVQGWIRPLERLLDRIAPRGGDRVVLLGDLVNGGPDNVGVLRRVRDLDATVLLGNQDLRLLGIRAGRWPLRKKDNIEDVLGAPDAGDLLDWLRRRPLAWRDGSSGLLAVHGGLLPPWSAADAAALAAEVEAELRGPDPAPLLGAMLDAAATVWREDLAGQERLALIANGLTRVRAVDDAGRMDFGYKGGLDGMPPRLHPWFEHPGRAAADTTVVFGHWSALGLHRAANAVCIDSGIRWGGKLTAYRAEDGEVVQIGAA